MASKPATKKPAATKAAAKTPARSTPEPKKEETRVARREPEPKKPVVAGGYEEDAGAGFADMGREDYAIPFLIVLQPLSPQLDEDNREKYIDGAQAGHIVNTVTKELYDEVTVIPVHRTHQFLEWIPRDNGGGLVGIHAPESALVTKARAKQAVGRIPLDAKPGEPAHELTESFSVFALLLLDDEGNYQHVIINFQSTQIKVYRQWMTRAAAITVKTDDNRSVQPPIFAHRYKLTTVKQENAKGKWNGWVINFDGDTAEDARLVPGSDLYEAARTFRNMVQTEGQRIVAARTEEMSAGAAAGAGDTDAI